MDMLDFVMSIIGISAYIAILVDFRENELLYNRTKDVESKRMRYREQLVEEKRRKKMAEAQQQRRVQREEELRSITEAVERLNDYEQKEILRKSRITAGKMSL